MITVQLVEASYSFITHCAFVSPFVSPRVTPPRSFICIFFLPHKYKMHRGKPIPRKHHPYLCVWGRGLHQRDIISSEESCPVYLGTIGACWFPFQCGLYWQLRGDGQCAVSVAGRNLSACNTARTGLRFFFFCPQREEEHWAVMSRCCMWLLVMYSILCLWTCRGLAPPCGDSSEHTRKLRGKNNLCFSIFRFFLNITFTYQQRRILFNLFGGVIPWDPLLIFNTFDYLFKRFLSSHFQSSCRN